MSAGKCEGGEEGEVAQWGVLDPHRMDERMTACMQVGRCGQGGHGGRVVNAYPPISPSFTYVYKGPLSGAEQQEREWGHLMPAPLVPYVPIWGWGMLKRLPPVRSEVKGDLTSLIF